MKYFRVYRPFKTQFVEVNLPVVLTIIRVLLIPILMLIYNLENEWKYLVAGSIFTLACITDWLDGYLARKLKQISVFGEFLDPVADKLIVTVALMLVMTAEHIPNILIPAVVIIGREITVSSLRELMSELGKRTSVIVNRLGKIKTLFQMVALGVLLASSPTTPVIIVKFGYVLLSLAAFLTIISMFVYIKLALHVLSDMDSK
ncbi:MAG: CDP-diacylglycerol--glycerol-3-phosphate 3-phosphatidyltransferase [Legionellales bacterium]|nr:CDP-diacylglycerol--glycerol-3-phosphate 3-phosphatidyltransferase [Legionellales bacterium]